MLDLIIPVLNAQLGDYFEKQFELADLITDGNGKRQPAVYCSKGEWDNINLGNPNGLSYWRKISEVTTSTTTEQQMVACLDIYEFTYPLEVIGAVPKEKLSIDDSYSEERLITTLIKNLSLTDLKTTLKAMRVDVTPGNYETNNVNILAQEYSEVQNINYNLAYFSLKVNVVVTIRQDCIPDECE